MSFEPRVAQVHITLHIYLVRAKLILGEQHLISDTVDCPRMRSTGGDGPYETLSIEGIFVFVSDDHVARGAALGGNHN